MAPLPLLSTSSLLFFTVYACFLAFARLSPSANHCAVKLLHSSINSARSFSTGWFVFCDKKARTSGSGGDERKLRVKHPDTHHTERLHTYCRCSTSPPSLYWPSRLRVR